jgi:hypothetical protein
MNKQHGKVLVKPAKVAGGSQGFQPSLAPSRLRRRSFLRNIALSSAALIPMGSALADNRNDHAGQIDLRGGISASDAAILRFLAAAELLETDLWQQYTEFTDQDSPYTDALEAIDDDIPDYVEQNTNDEFSHQNFLNAFLAKMHRSPVNLESFRTLSSSPVAPVQSPRLTNLMHLNVDTSWYLRYRSEGNPDFGDTFGQVVTINDRPAIPVQDQGLYTANQMQAIANTAAFHFAMIEQGGSSLYDALSLNCTSLLALHIVSSIGGTEVAHFEIWHDVAGGAPAVDSGDGLVFPDLGASEETSPEDVMPKPCKFISEDLPLCSVIRPTSLALAGAQAAVQFLSDTGLFVGQSDTFFRTLMELAKAADRAAHGASGH